MAFSNINTVLTNYVSDTVGVSNSVAVFLIVVIGIWSLVWKGMALWKSAGKKQLVWFIVFIFINTVGILEILYIYVFSKMDFSSKNTGSGKKDSVLRNRTKKKK